jgi:glyoxylase-like metal-dependent hydrolase (beta-lactamase superfamily II)
MFATQNRRAFLRSSAGGLAGLASASLLGGLGGCQTLPARVARLPVQRLDERISVISGAPGNVLVFAAGDGAVLVDSGSAQLARSVRDTLAGMPVRTVINTHYHADQTGGNALFAGTGAEIRAHAITRQWLAADYYVPAEDRWMKAPPQEAVPTVTFRDQGEMKWGGETIEHGYLLEAHTRGDIYVYLRDANVLAVGDVASPLRDPALDWYAGGWLGGRADAMDDLVELANEDTRIVPAYGPVMTFAQLKAERDMMVHLYNRTAELTAKGHSARDLLDVGVLDEVGRKFEDPYRFLYDVAKGLQAHYTNFGGNVV